MGKSLVDLVTKGKLSGPSAVGAIEGANAFLKAQSRYYHLEKTHAETKDAFKAKAEFKKNTILMWVQERTFVEDILGYRDAKTHRNQQRRPGR